MNLSHLIQPGCYIDSHHGHYAIPTVIAIARDFGFPVDPFVEFALTMYAEHWHENDFPGEALTEESDCAIHWLNDNRPLEGHVWDWNNGDFGLWRLDDDTL